MLKIKDNVDLKELEKFDFSEYEENIKIDGVPILYEKYCYKDFYIYITKDRKIYRKIGNYEEVDKANQKINALKSKIVNIG